jgi:hypothetical protein
MAFVNTSQDWLILQISLASLRVAHMASHWRMTVDAAKFNSRSLKLFQQPPIKMHMWLQVQLPRSMVQ